MSFDCSDFGLFRDFPEPVFVMDPEGTILDANEVLASRFFCKPDEIRGRNVYDLCSLLFGQPEIVAYRKSKTEEVLRTGRHLFFDDQKDGRYWRHFIHPIRNAEGAITRLLFIVHDITLEKQEEYQSRKADLVFKALLDAVPGSVAILDAQGRLSGFNQYAVRVFGKSEEELYGSDPFEIIHPEDRGTVFTKFRQILESGYEDSVEVRVFMAGNHEDIRWFMLHARKAVIDGQPLVVTVNIDIDERKRMEQSLVDSKRWLKLAMQAAHIGIWDWNLRTGETLWSDELWKLSGYDKSSSPCSFDLWTSIIHPDDRQQVLRTVKINEIDNARNMSIEYRICLPDGSVRWMLSRGGPVYDPQGKVERLVGTMMDITELKLMEDELRRSRNRLDFTLEQCHLGWWEFNPKSNTTIRTLEHDRIFGYETLLPEWHFSRFLDHVIADDRPVIRRLCMQALEKQEDFSFECRILRNDGKIGWIWVSGGFQYDRQSETLLMSGIVQDITERKRQIEERERLQIELQQAQKMEVVGQLAGGIAHDFNNALTAILGNTDLLTKRLSPSFPYHDNIEVIRKAAMRSANMTRQLLAFARKQMITPKVCILDDEIEILLPMIRSLIGSRISFVWRPKSNKTSISIDPAQLDQILINLCINARDAIFDTGTITIETSVITIDPTGSVTSSPGQLPAGDYVRIAVFDTGCGIDTNMLPHIYEPFFTTKASGKGTGLGLSTVYGILMQNKGGIDCLTDPGSGTTFVVWLPVHKESSSGESVDEDEVAIRTIHETILLVEDAPDILAILKGVLEENGFTIIAALNANAAFELARKHPGVIDLLVTDIMLPDINGIRLSEQLRSKRPDLKTLFMSGYTHDLRESGSQRHLNPQEEGNFIQKPFSIDTFMKKVFRMLNPEKKR